MKIFTSGQIRQIDEYTIRTEPIRSEDLMERAAGAMFEWYISRFQAAQPVKIFCGPGNNGGDGLALARLLSVNGYRPEVYIVKLSTKFSGDFEINRRRLEKETRIRVIEIAAVDEFPETVPGTVIIDAIFGSGLARPAEGIASQVIGKINNSGALVISIDIPSGLFGEDNSHNDPLSVIKANHTLSFQFPRLSFLFPENEVYTGEWHILPIGLHPDAIRNTMTNYYYLEKEDIRVLLKTRKKFDHKGRFGHGLLIGGTYGKTGAIVLGARAALRTGIGLLTCHIPSSGNTILQTAVPEAMIMNDNSSEMVTLIGSTERYSAVGVGPGMGTDAVSAKTLQALLLNNRKPMVIDADALNILSMNKGWLKELCPGTILTPHPGEFDRLAGKSGNGSERLRLQCELSAQYKCIIILKGAYTSVTAPDGRVWFNSTGNPGMATAGAGDVLTGMVLSLLAQGYEPVNAALTGVYLHGVAGDCAAGRKGFEALISSDIIDDIGTAYNIIRTENLR